ncbi:MAG TPA: dihydrolipoyllysine-residue acetyltransferase [Steroidobacteraceae bacterium]|nr:dihydrolipoyllysine-residue acetyltransferase [Steroidobacteraceae bacterium]
MSQTIEVRVPDLGNFTEVGVIDVLVKAGDTVAIDTPLITLETEKATMDVPSTAAGVIAKVHVQKGGKVSAGSLVVTLLAAKGTATPGASPAIAPASAGTAAAAAAAVAPAAVTPRSVDVLVPDMGNFTEVGVIDVLVKVGDKVEVDTPLATLETEKATMDVPSTAAGTVEAVHVQKGGKVSAGSRVVTLSGVAGPAQAAAPSTSSVAAPATAAAPRAAPPAAPPPPARAAATLPPVNETGFGTAHAGPSVRKLARELGVDLGRVKGSGQRGRITHEDVKAWVKAMLSGGLQAAGPALPQVPRVDFAKFGPVEVRPLGRIQKISGPRLHAAWVNVPHVTQYDEADITALEAERAKLKDKAAAAGVKITPLAFIVRACVLALKEYPVFNASLDGENMVLKKYFHVGFAADTPNGLLVPVIRNADQLDLFGIAHALGDLSERARKGTLKGGEMQGGSFTISSLGGIGGTAFTPIINAPEVAILGVSRTQVKPVWDGQEFKARQMLPLSLSYDHRLIDGAMGARFAVYLSKVLADPDALLAGLP